jgi:hypothetical protein
MNVYFEYIFKILIVFAAIVLFYLFVMRRIGSLG